MNLTTKMTNDSFFHKFPIGRYFILFVQIAMIAQTRVLLHFKLQALRSSPI